MVRRCIFKAFTSMTIVHLPMPSMRAYSMFLFYDASMHALFHQVCITHPCHDSYIGNCDLWCDLHAAIDSVLLCWNCLSSS